MPATCECDYDCVGDPAHYVRSNRSTLCPEHDMCESCDERLATMMQDGFKFCEQCAREVGMKGEWTPSIGGWVLSVQNEPDHWAAPNEWRIVALVTRNYRGAWIVEIGSEFGIAGTACRKQTVASFEEAKALAERLTAVEICEKREGQ